MISGSFTPKLLNVTITLGTGAFGNSGQNTVNLVGHRVVATVNKGGFPNLDRANIRVYGVNPSIMNTVSTLGIPRPMVRWNNTVTLEAGDVNGVAVVYSGYMMACWQDFSESPETSLMIDAFGGMGQKMAPAAPISFSGPTDVATIMSGLAVTMGMKFENNGVQVTLPSAYFSGSAGEQADAVARKANIEMAKDTATNPNTLAIWPKSGTRVGAIPLISVASGLIGYPMYQSNGMSFRCLFNPNIRMGGQIQMQSSVGNAAVTTNDPGVPAGTQTGGPSGLWYVVDPLTHSLSSEVVGGPWFTDISCVRVPGTPGQSS